MLYTVIEKAQEYLVDSLLYQMTGDDVFDSIVYWSSFICEILAAVGVVILVLRNAPVRKRSGTLNRLIFWECVMVFCLNILQISLVPLAYAGSGIWADIAFDIAWAVNEGLYLAIVLQWLVCVDYCLYHSRDHIRRRYSRAAIPILVVMLLDILSTIIFRVSDDVQGGGVFWVNTTQTVLRILELTVEAGYILTAVYLVRDHAKRSREPGFLRLEAFIIPFIFGTLFRFYDASFLGFGIILTYAAIKRREKYIVAGTGLYNADYLDCICAYWDKKGIKDGSALLISAPGHERDLAGILDEFHIPDCFNIDMGDGGNVMIAGFLRKTAFRMAEEMLFEAAGEAATPFKPEIEQMRRDDGETMTDFGVRIKEACRLFFS